MTFPAWLDLNVVWFALIGTLLAGYAILFGVVAILGGALVLRRRRRRATGR